MPEFSFPFAYPILIITMIIIAAIILLFLKMKNGFKNKNYLYI